ncbi:cytochrome d ubiquinol oxidase subunit II [Burkholderia sp. GS2Y]|uniref:Cytochrome d ubiquinol oxidase subunit II n=1 Tax=Burkholderia theae TaxID=3143496 RepID=A0ABU9WJN1_9BURK
MLEPDTLRLIWWLLIAVLFALFAVTDGFDFGALILLPWVTARDEQRRVVLNAVGATWEGNQTWLITAIGATFAAWPMVYAASFSVMYPAMMLALFALFARPVGFDYRSKLPGRGWRAAWDCALFAGGFIPTFTFGLLVGNLFVGLPFTVDRVFRITATTSFTGLFHPFAILVAAAAVALFTMHGGAYVQKRAEAPFARVIGRFTTGAALVFMLLFVACGIWVTRSLPGLQNQAATLLQAPAAGASSSTELVAGGWAGNFERVPALLALPLLAVACAVQTALLTGRGRWQIAFCTSALTVLSAVGTAAVALFPVLLLSSSDPASSLTVWNSSSSPHTLQIMLFVAALFVPLIMLYTAFVYRVLRGPVTVQHVRDQGTKAY